MRARTRSLANRSGDENMLRTISREREERRVTVETKAQTVSQRTAPAMELVGSGDDRDSPPRAR
ncbi:Hypothetical protein A7982_04812 [Minicystis rosea]|nr:Hypothetical protein A7982_04812 [Minicystis rosea]